MKKQILLLTAVLMLATPLAAQRVVIDNFDQLQVHFSTPVVSVDEEEYLMLSAKDYILGGEVGAPALPVSSQLIVVPFCSGYEVLVENAVYDTLDLPEGRVMPLQPSRSKSDRSIPTVVVDEQVYATDAFFGRPLAHVEQLGVGRDRNYALLTWSPVSVNPVSGKMVVCRSADVTVRYEGSDAGATMKHYDRYHTPAFTLGPTLNTLYSGAKDVRSTAPVRMVIMAPERFRCAALNDFVDWKRQQGMMVDLIYMANNSATDTYAVRLQQMYDEASDAAPAPTYLILVGDVAQLPAFASNLSSGNIMHRNSYDLDDHVTDLYYVTWTPNDKLPDCYQGRFSATDTTTLRNIIDKTLYYERYQFADDSYLSRAALIAGKDNGYNSDNYDNAWRYADPTMDYIAYYYVNADNGYNTVYYYKNDPNRAPDGVTVSGSSQESASASTLRTRYNSGVGWVNYSAHGDWDEWSIPSFTVSHVNQMRNYNKPSFMIGNCCLSNKFDRNVCLGESLLRKDERAGAVGYIGATNSTFWGEDFYWSVGVRNNVTHTMSPSYDANRKGMYDRLFHTHGEVLADYIVTAGQIMMAGNMSVNRTYGTSSWGTSVVEYYWEIYELMGDPSLMPWMGTAADLTNVDVTKYSETHYHVATNPGAYVAFVTDSTHFLLGAAYADANGLAILDLVEGPAVVDSTVLLSITSQGYKPYFSKLSNINVGVQEVSTEEVSVWPNPASNVTSVSASGLRRVMLLNVMGQTLQTVAAQGDRCTVSLTGVPAGLYLLRVESAAGTTTRKLVVN